MQRDFAVGQMIFIKNFSSGPRWIPAIITCREGSVNYRCLTTEGIEARRHCDQIRPRVVEGYRDRATEEIEGCTDKTTEETDPGQSVSGEGRTVTMEADKDKTMEADEGGNCHLDKPREYQGRQLTSDTLSATQRPVTADKMVPSPVLRRSSRIRKSPERLNL